MLSTKSIEKDQMNLPHPAANAVHGMKIAVIMSQKVIRTALGA